MDIEAMLVTMKEELELWDGEGAIDIGDVLLQELDKEQRQMLQRDKQHEHTIRPPWLREGFADYSIGKESERHGKESDRRRL